jgi:hypothetical protein
MTDKAVSALTSLTGANTATGDLIYIVDISEASAADRSKKITAEELQNYMKKFPATISVGNATPAASGAGISFPATASASSDANTLDDYEEGTASSVAISGASSAGTGTYGTNVVKYVKIGKLVFVGGYLTWTAHTGTGAMTIAGLPFPSENTAGLFTAASIGFFGDISLTAGNFPTLYQIPNSSTIDIYQSPTGGGSASSVTLDSAGSLIFSICYIAG